MTTSVLIEDKIAGNSSSNKYELELPADRMKVRDLIRAYVIDAVERFNQTPIDRSSRNQSREEMILNPARPTKHTQRRDCEAECNHAFKAFSSNGFFLLVDGNQVSDLDEEVVIKADTTISFLRLTPLVGG